MPTYDPPVGFHFKVEVVELRPDDSDCRFSEVSGLSVEVTTEEVPEGGQNRYVQVYPARSKYAPIVLKRALYVSSGVVAWTLQCIESLKIQPMTVHVSLLDENHAPLMTWNVVNAFPTKWSVSDLNAATNGFVIESIQLAYQYFTARTV